MDFEEGGFVHTADETDPAALAQMQSHVVAQEWDFENRRPWFDAYDPFAGYPFEGTNCNFQVRLSGQASSCPTPPPNNPSPNPQPSTCRLQVRLRRNPLVYIVKSLTLDVLIVIAGIAAVLINPAVPPQVSSPSYDTCM